MCMLVPAFCGLLMAPESPMWLARKGREEEAKETLMLVRNSMEEIIEELRVIQNSLTEDKTFYNLLKESVRKYNLLPIILSSVMVILKESCGIAVIGMYIVYIFQQAGVGLSPCWSSVVVGLSRIACNGLASILLHNAPRKLLLVAGNIQITISLGAIGTFFFVQSQGQDVSWLGWLPLSSLIVYMIGYAGAMGPTTWSVALEILPGPVRSLGYSITSIFYLTTVFTTSKLFDITKDLIGFHGTFWSYSVASLLYCILTVVFIPETRRLSLQAVEDYWKNLSTNTENPT